MKTVPLRVPTALLVACLSLMESCYDTQAGRKKAFQEQLGTYVLDVHRTALGGYSKDSDAYKKLQITFKADSTFTMNMRVPFIFDSVGTWKAGNLEEWNYLYYKNNSKINTQFTRPEYDDSTFLLNSTTPQTGAEPIQEIYFRKINR
ncbi:MAG TPA: hypothetical protein VFP87_02360 [Chitinophagaceae bacterium]|nr:hypothetical protein [Chitinophagaceae bacterium]